MSATPTAHWSSAEVSATEALRTELDRSDQPAMLRRLLEQARTHIDAGAGPDRQLELRGLQRLRSDLPILRNMVAANKRDVARVDQTIARTRQSLADAQARLYELTRPRRFRRPDQHAIDETSHRIQGQQRYLGRVEGERARSAASSTGAVDASPTRSGPSPASPRSKPTSPAAATGSSAIRPNSPGSLTSPAASPGPPLNPTRRCPDRIPPSPTTTSRRCSGPSI